MSMNLMERGLHLGGSAMLLIGAMRARSGLGRLALAAAAGGLLARAANGRNPGDQGSRPGHTLHLARTITIDRPPEELYAFWRNFENLPRIMRHLDSVRIIDARRSRWRARAPHGTIVEWDAEITHDIPSSEIGWRSLPGAGVPNSGVVRFRPSPLGHGTQLQVEMRYAVPAGRPGELLWRLLGENPQQQLDEDLQQFRRSMEGEGMPAAGPRTGRRDETRTT